jgi:SnoaL-like domain
MPQPPAAEMRATVERHVELWNAGEKEPWLAHMKAAAVGGLTMDDPVGTPTKRGTDILGDVWDHSFSQGVWTLTIEHLVTCANELAMVVRNESVVDGTTVVVRSIETYRFGDDGSLYVRTYFDMPAGSDYAEWTNTLDS